MLCEQLQRVTHDITTLDKHRPLECNAREHFSLIVVRQTIKPDLTDANLSPEVPPETDTQIPQLSSWLALTLQAGPHYNMNWYSPNLNATIPAGRRGNDADAMCGNAVMFDAVAGKILTVGGSPDYGVRAYTDLIPYTAIPSPSSYSGCEQGRCGS